MSDLINSQRRRTLRKYSTPCNYSLPISVPSPTQVKEGRCLGKSSLGNIKTSWIKNSLISYCTRFHGLSPSLNRIAYNKYLSWTRHASHTNLLVKYKDTTSPLAQDKILYIHDVEVVEMNEGGQTSYSHDEGKTTFSAKHTDTRETE